MGHYCRFCGRSRPNERFSGRGHRTHVCQDCRKIPIEKRREIEALGEIRGFLHAQSRISPKNIARLAQLSTSTSPAVAERAAVMLEVARLAPGKRGRLRRVRTSRPDLWQRFVEAGLVESVLPSFDHDDEPPWDSFEGAISMEDLPEDVERGEVSETDDIPF